MPGIPPEALPEVHKSNFWGTWLRATLDWCEENYVALDFVAEFWNTLSNLMIILPCVFGLYIVWRQRMELRFALAYSALMVVGIGSWLFHMTLTWHFQVRLLLWLEG